jgi:hypothetical protein
MAYFGTAVYTCSLCSPENGTRSCGFCSREFGEALEAVRGEKARVVAVTSPERAEAANQERNGFFTVNKVL